MLRNSIIQAVNQVIDVIGSIQGTTNHHNQHVYSESNIGKHVRHINDHFLALQKGLKTGIIDYNCRNRGTAIETDEAQALLQMHSLINWISQCDEINFDKSVKVYSEIDFIQTQSNEFHSNIARELLYLINHTIHHVAHIGLIAKQQGVLVPNETGLAPCTKSYMRSIKT